MVVAIPGICLPRLALPPQLGHGCTKGFCQSEQNGGAQLDEQDRQPAAEVDEGDRERHASTGSVVVANGQSCEPQECDDPMRGGNAAHWQGASRPNQDCHSLRYAPAIAQR